MKRVNNFSLVSLSILVGESAVLFGANQLVSLKYVEDMRSASIHVEVTLTDSGNGVLSNLQGMENVTLEYKDDVGEVHSFALIV